MTRISGANDARNLDRNINVVSACLLRRMDASRVGDPGPDPFPHLTLPTVQP